jgi:hypothetical protein
MTADLISVVEAAYDLAADERSLVTGLIERVAGGLNQRFEVSLSTYARSWSAP